jgi:hypothetical protein
MFGCDPYVECKSMDQTFRTRTIFSTVTPSWQETHELLVFDKTTQRVELSIFDFGNDVVADTFLGKAVLNLEKVPHSVLVKRTLKLSGAKKGWLAVSLVYTPLAKDSYINRSALANADEEMIDDVVADLISGDETSDIIMPFVDTECDEDDIILTLDGSRDSREWDRRSAGGGLGMGSRREGSHTDRDRDTASANINGGAYSDPSADAAPDAQPGRRLSDLVSQVKVFQSAPAYQYHHTGVLSISSIRCYNLRKQGTTYIDLLKATANFMVTVTFLNSQKETKLKLNNLNPQFDESFNYLVKDPADKAVSVKLISKGKLLADRVVCEAVVGLHEVIDCCPHALVKVFEWQNDGQVLKIGRSLVGAQAEAEENVRIERESEAKANSDNSNGDGRRRSSAASVRKSRQSSAIEDKSHNPSNGTSSSHTQNDRSPDPTASTPAPIRGKSRSSSMLDSAKRSGSGGEVRDVVAAGEVRDESFPILPRMSLKLHWCVAQMQK